MYEKIKELDELRKQGLLSDEEFNEEKKKILSGDMKDKSSSSYNIPSLEIYFPFPLNLSSLKSPSYLSPLE